MNLQLSSNEKALLQRGLREALLQVKDGRRGALADAELLFDMALTGDRRLGSLMQSFLVDADERARKRGFLTMTGR